MFDPPTSNYRGHGVCVWVGVKATDEPCFFKLHGRKLYGQNILCFFSVEGPLAGSPFLYTLSSDVSSENQPVRNTTHSSRFASSIIKLFPRQIL